MKSKNIGIVTWYKAENFGTNLQAYALYKYLVDMGYNCCMINEFTYAHLGLKYKILNILHIIGIQSIIKKYFGKAKNRERLRKAIDFFDKNTNIRYVYNTNSYLKLLREVDTFVSGSDQIWNPNFLVPFYLLDFAADNKRIAYSSSLGVSSINDVQKKLLTPLLNKYDAIGIREQTGVDLVNSLIDSNNAIQVVDPTLLLSKDSWYSLAETSTLVISGEYIFCYMIGDRINYAKEIADVIRKSGYKKVCIVRSCENPNFSLMIENVEVVYIPSNGIEDFLFLLYHSTLVCTDSFHATVISMKFQKQFVEFMRFAFNDPKSQNSRIIDILHAYEVSSQIYNDQWKYIPVIDYGVVNNKISKDINKSEIFLKEALNS